MPGKQQNNKVGHSVVENLPRNYFLHILRQTDRHVDCRRTLVWTFIINQPNRIWAHTLLWRNCQYCDKVYSIRMVEIV